ncbi:MAG TPA: serine/threonine-protein kinase [Phycisphaerae bacterium]|nr:serine/threonine-protein kinase [Phycisphaerae bacterium]HRY70055.1 serine/threonine-protein kinase [Phycisphaerae bacterium]HSA27331.1 serine/threonine-protein kinase [Phycisphaerae bacterium]
MSTPPQNAKDIFLAVLEAEPAQRAAMLDDLCKGEEALRAQVESLLRAHDQHDSLLDSPRIDLGLPDDAADFGADCTLEYGVTEGPDTAIGPYKLLQQIGDGGMGVVYMAEQTEPVQRRVALKIIKPGMDSRQVMARFDAERHALALMDHPNIARVLDAGTTQSGRPYFVMELVKGIPITRYCDEHHLTPRERLELFVPVCHAVQHAHQKGIIHRDIKPTNVLVAEYDDRPVPKIIDFGVAKAINQQLTERTVFTQLGQVVGTIEYMSPEQAKLNELDVDTRSDIYSLGVLLYELLTGETPFDRQRLRTAAFDEMLRIIREEEPPKPSLRLSASQSLASVASNRQTELRKLSTLVHGELDWIVMKALEKERNRRYETANALAADVAHYLADEPVAACPPSAGYRFRKFARRNRSLLTTAAVVGVILLLASIVSTWQAIRATQAQGEARLRADEATAARLEAERAAAEAQAVSDFLVNDLIGSASPEKTLGREVTVKEVLANAEKAIDTAFRDQPLREAAIRQAMSRVYTTLGEYGAPKRHARRALELRTQLLGSEHRDTLSSMCSLGIVLGLEGYSEQARILLEQVLAGRKRILGPEHPDTLDSMVHLALARQALGESAEAQKLLEEALAIQKRILGPEHSSVLDSMHQLGHILLSRHEWEQGRRLHEEILAIQKRVLGPEHPRTLKYMSCLGAALTDEGKLDEARKVLEETIDLERRILGPEHSSTLATCGRLARTLWLSGKPEEARKLCEEILAVHNRVHGAEHPLTLDTMNYVAITLESLGQHDQARRLYEQVLAAQKRILGPEHPQTLQSMYNLGSVLRRLGKPDESRKVLEQTVALQEQVLGPEHPQTLYSRHNLAVTLVDLRKSVEACGLYQKNLEIQKRILGPSHSDTMRSMGNLAILLWCEGKKDEARELCDEMRAIAPEDPNTLGILINVANDLRVRGMPVEARKLQEETMAIQKRVLGPEHPNTLLSMHNLALSLCELGQLPDACRLLEETLAMQKRVVGPEHPDALRTTRNLERLRDELSAPGSRGTEPPNPVR